MTQVLTPPRPLRLPMSTEVESPLRDEHLKTSILRADIKLVGSKGFAATSVADIIALAGVGRSTFYRFFTDKGDCYLAALDKVIDRVSAELAAVERVAEPLLADEPAGTRWARRVQTHLAAVIRLLENEPELARFTLVEVNASGREAQRRYFAALRRLERGLDRGSEYPEGDGPRPDRLATMALGGAIRLLSNEALSDGAPKVRRLAPDLLFALLMPYLGPATAAEEVERAYGSD